MRLSPFLTLLSAIGACAMMFVCLFAGYTTTTLSSVDMFNVNVSQIANTSFSNSTGNGCNCVEFINGTLTINGTSSGDNTVEVVYLGLSQYFAVYTMNWCEGEYLPNYQDPNAAAVLTHCEKPSPGRHFDLVSIIENAIDNVSAELNQTLSLHSLDWPNGITSAFDYVKSAVNAMIAFFLIGIGSLLLATAAGTLSLFRSSKNTTVFLLITSVVALFCLGITAGLATGCITTVVNGINANGYEIGASANQGNTFMAMIWSAVALLFISTLTVGAQLCTGSGRDPSPSKRRYRKRQYEGYLMPNRSYAPVPPTMPYFMPSPRHPASSAYDYWDPYSSRRTLVPHPDDYYGEDDFS